MLARRLSSVRARITTLILVPLLSLVALWAFVTSVTYGDAVQLMNGKRFQDKSLLPTQKLISELQKERRLSLWQLGAPANADRSALDAQRRATDAARAVVERNARDGDLREAVVPAVRARIDALVARMQVLGSIRRTVDAHTAVEHPNDYHTVDRQRTLAEISGMIDAGFAIYNAAVPSDGRIATDARVLTAVGRAREFLAREDALLTGALSAGRLTASERAEFAQFVGAQRNLYADTAPNLPPADADRYRDMAASPPFQQLRRLEEQVMRDTGRETRTTRTNDEANAAPPTGQQPDRQQQPTGQQPTGQQHDDRHPDDRQQPDATRTSSAVRTNLPVDPAAWRGAADQVTERLYTFENSVLAGVTERATGIAINTLAPLGLAGLLGLVAVVLSSYIAVRISRRLLRECRALAAAVGDFARKRLPLLADQVRAGDVVDPADEPPAADYRIAEIREISESFVATRDAVLVAAAREIAVRRGLSEVFVNLARRNQVLLHRQLSLLDTMEHRTEDPAELADLFRLDHLATRMRRHAEGLVILAGKHAGRGWRRPVPLVDVVRGAVAEVEDYPRVRVQQLPRVALVGAAVADVIHLLAELVENATSYSPPQAPVLVSGHAVGNGFAVEIEDRGLGMTAEALQAANEKLADPPEFDPSDSARLGLFVVARLARRHDIRVTLRQSAYGGTTAIALLPANLVTDVPEPEPAVRRPAGTGTGTTTAQQSVVRLVSEPMPEPEPPTGPEPSPPAPELTADGLPRRRRQQHMAPQLRDRTQERRQAAFDRPPPPGLPAPADAAVRGSTDRCCPTRVT
ncbi:sensor histidine kinase, partial [Actinomadura kijaniata]|uniref:sensor histidine kinase n=1 Tax=Actinomadura kijaniata TaxID=46161 RepID=UPI003F198529